MTNTIPTNKTNSISTNATSTMTINSDDKTDCYILHTVLLVIILLFIIAIISCHYTNYRSKEKRIGTLTILKWKTMN